MKKLFIVLMLGFSGIATYAQDSDGDYRSAIGGRLGTSYYDILSVSYKTFLFDAGAIELNGGFGVRGYIGERPFSLSFSGSYQHHFRIPVNGLKWFIGGGLTAAPSFSSNDELRDFSFGLFPTGGVDYKFPRIPLNVSADIRPTFMVTSTKYYPDVPVSFGLSARYVIR